MKKRSIFSLISLLCLLALTFTGCKPEIELDQVPDTTPPSIVTNLTAITGNGKITLNWTNPADKDLAKVVICQDGVCVAEITDKTTSKEITGLTHGIKYKFTVKAVDMVGNTSDVVTKEVPLYVLTDTPVVLTEYISEQDKVLPAPPEEYGGTSWQYVAFGDYPQTHVACLPSGTVETDTVDKGGLKYICGSDGNYYVKAKATPFDTNIKFDDGTTIETNSYYFKVEPIVWRVLDKAYTDVASSPMTGKLLLAEKTLCKGPHGPNKYDTSEIKGFLNGNFINQAFSTTAQEKINTTTVDNSYSTIWGRGESKQPEDPMNGNICAPTQDKIFLLSTEEISRATYGFDEYNKYIGDEKGTSVSARIRKPTDYATAMGSYLTNGGTIWWLRSPVFNDNGFVRSVLSNGNVTQCSIRRTDISVVPALCLPADAF